MRYGRTMTRSKSKRASDLDQDEWTGRINGSTPLAALGWSAEASRQQYDYSRGRASESDRLRGFLTYRINPQFKLSASAGRERNDFASLGKQTGPRMASAPTGRRPSARIFRRSGRSVFSATDTRIASVIASR